ncbi:MAG TPA: T9SS type A sorting domain-containing protein, partial [Bacteroidia bacterium]|nr:T9SS type A sorting domain-containing protein [Bacteroidia bacterium]
SGYTQSLGAGSSDILLMRTNSNGNLKWFKSYGGTDSEVGNSIVELTNGDVACIGATITTSSGASHIACLKTDSTGQLKWQNKYNPSTYYNVYHRTGSQILYLSDKNLLITGKVGDGPVNDAAPYLLKIDTSGSVLWGKSYLFNSGICGAHSIYEMPSSTGFMMYVDIQGMPVLVNTDNSGVISWFNDYNVNINSQEAVIHYIPSIGFGIIGSTSSPDSNVVIIQTNLSGTTPCDLSHFGAGNTNSFTTTVSTLAFSSSTLSNQATIAFNDTAVISSLTNICTNVSIKNIQQIEGFEVFPNPTQLNFMIETNSTDKQTLQVFDVNGKLVLMQTINGKTNIDASNLAEGVYNLSLQNANGVVNKRLVIVR